MARGPLWACTPDRLARRPPLRQPEVAGRPGHGGEGLLVAQAAATSAAWAGEEGEQAVALAPLDDNDPVQAGDHRGQQGGMPYHTPCPGLPAGS